MCQDFAKEVVLPAEGKQEEILFMNRAVNHFAKNDEFEETHFLNEVLGDKVFKKEYAAHEDDEDQSPKQGYMDLIPEVPQLQRNQGKEILYRGCLLLPYCE